ncbi:MAG: CBS domain-containing protein [Smithellaceae bacterium]|jgi:CBS domain-containing protein/sporulation protein YlmC with PRC-barrel domain
MAINHEPQVFLFLSRILGKKIVGAEGKVLGRVYDLTAEFVEPYPAVTGLVFSPTLKKRFVILPWKYVIDLGEEVSVAINAVSELSTLSLQQGELLLKEDLLDKQVVDTDGAKIRRVNDLQFLKTSHGLHLVHVDVGFRGLIRRVGLIKPFDAMLQSLFDYKLPNQLISWKFVQPLHSPDLLRLNITQNRLGQIHPADLADILEDLDIRQRGAVFKALDVETAAEALEETDPKVQVSLINDLNTAEASDIIEEMSLSEAADLLGDLPKAKAEGILKEMEKEIADDVKELLTHPEREAGGMMTTSYLSFRPSTTVREALEKFRREAEDIDLVYYVYVTDEEDVLLGVISLRDLILADSDKRLEEIMDDRVISVKLDDKDDTIAENFAKYAVTAIPVVDENDRMQGTILFKNLLDVVAPHLGK